MRNLEEARRKTGQRKVVESIHATIIGNALAVMLDQGPAEKDTGETKEKGHNANQVVMWIHANPGSHVESRFSRKETREKRA